MFNLSNINNPDTSTENNPRGSNPVNITNQVDDEKWNNALIGFEKIQVCDLSTIPTDTSMIRYIKLDGGRVYGGYVQEHIIGKNGSMTGKKLTRVIKNINLPQSRRNISWIVNQDNLKELWVKYLTAHTQVTPLIPSHTEGHLSGILGNRVDELERTVKAQQEKLAVIESLVRILVKDSRSFQ
jgi:hypothetical protein